MKTENYSMFENMEFSSAAYAKKTADECREKLSHMNKAMISGAISTVMFLLTVSFGGNPVAEKIFAALWLVTMAATIVMTGWSAEKKLFSLGWKIAVTVWYVVPFFPANLAAAAIALYAVVLILVAGVVLCPIGGVLMNGLIWKRELRKAEGYLSFCRPVDLENII